MMNQSVFAPIVYNCKHVSGQIRITSLQKVTSNFVTKEFADQLSPFLSNLNDKYNITLSQYHALIVANHVLLNMYGLVGVWDSTFFLAGMFCK